MRTGQTLRGWKAHAKATAWMQAQEIVRVEFGRESSTSEDHQRIYRALLDRFADAERDARNEARAGGVR